MLSLFPPFMFVVCHGVQLSGGCCFESAPDIFLNKVLCPPPPPIYFPLVFLLKDFLPNICISYISMEAKWQPATRVHELPDFTVLAVQTQCGRLKLGQKHTASHKTEYTYCYAKNCKNLEKLIHKLLMVLTHLKKSS